MTDHGRAKELVEQYRETRLPCGLGAMSKITLLAVAALGLSAVFVLFLIWRSKEGHENEKGFHPGPADESPDAEAQDDPKVRPTEVLSRESTASITAKK